MADNKKIATDVLAAVGGAENVTTVAHCMTRLRFTLKDIDLPDTKAVQKIDGVIGAQVSGGQFQVIIGQNVPKVYDELCAMGGFAKQAAIDENLDPDAPKEKLTIKGVFNAILNYLSGSMVPMIPVLLCAGLFKTVGVLLGSTMLGVLADDSDFIVLMDMLYNAAFYFMPVYLGYNAAKQLGVTPVLGAFAGGILIEPTFEELATAGSSFSVYGIPCTPSDYSSTVVPILLTVWAMSYIEKFFKKYVPDTLSTVFTPFLTMAVTVPIELCLMAPIGGWVGTGIGYALDFLGSSGGILTIVTVGLVAALWLPLVVTGMHITLAVLAVANFMVLGYDAVVFVGTTMCLFAGYGVELACFFKLRDKDEKSKALGYFISNIVGGVGEPFIYGIAFRYRKTFLCDMVAAFIGGALAAILGVTAYVVGAGSNALCIVAFMGGSTSNLVCGVIAAAVSFVLGFIFTWFFGFTEDELENGPVSERE